MSRATGFLDRKTTFNLLFIMIILAQIFFWMNTRKIFPDMVIIDNPPGLKAAEALALGDTQFYFRYLALELQNAGDGYGRFTPLKDYDYQIVQNWLYLLDGLDYQSNFTPSIAAYYYGVTQYRPDVRYIIEYLEDSYNRDPYVRWWWLAQAVNLANHRLGDKRLALRLAHKLAISPATNMPIWGRQMPAFIHEQLGEQEQSFLIIKGILENVNKMTPEELNFMTYFINTRLDEIKQSTRSDFNRKDYESKTDKNFVEPKDGIPKDE